MAVLSAVLMLQTYLEGRIFTVRTDQDDLRFIIDMKDVTGKLARWRLRLQELSFDVVNREGVKKPADALSRLETTGADERDLEDDIAVLLLEMTFESTFCVCENCDALSVVNRRMPLVLDIEGD